MLLERLPRRALAKGNGGIYGVVLVLTGIFGADKTTDGSKTAGNVNLWVGICLIIFAAAMQGWALWRPTVIDEKQLEEEKSEQEDESPAH